MKSHSLIKSITTGSVLLIVGSFLVGQIIGYIYVSGFTEKSLRENLDQQLALLGNTLEASLWSLDNHSIILIGDSYMAATDSASITVTESVSGQVIYSKAKDNFSKVIFGQRDILHNGKKIGIVKIGLSTASQEQELLRFMVYSLFVAVLIIVSLIIVVRRLIHNNLTTPLTELGEWSDCIASGNYDSARPSIKLAELHALVEKFQNMSQKIQHREEDLLRFHKNLQHLVDEKTQKLKMAQAELLQRERLATLGEITATVSHELRNPLATIKNALFLIQDAIEKSRVHLAARPLELADRNIQRCVTIIEELNCYAREKKLECTETDVDEWLLGVLEEFVIPAGIDCSFNLNSGMKALFDPEKLRQVVVNLVNNAIDALNDEGSTGKSLVVTTRRMNDAYQISVSDNGCGMSKDVQARMFDPLYSTKGFGVGLGMVIVKNIVDRHQGVVGVESKLSEGTTITLQLPQHVSDGSQ